MTKTQKLEDQIKRLEERVTYYSDKYHETERELIKRSGDYDRERQEAKVEFDQTMRRIMFDKRWYQKMIEQAILGEKVDEQTNS